MDQYQSRGNLLANCKGHWSIGISMNTRQRGHWSIPECTKMARFSAVAAAILTAPPQNRAIFKAPRCAISSAKKTASERRFSLRLKGTNLIPTAEFPAIPESAAKIASERRCAILVHSGPYGFLLKFIWTNGSQISLKVLVCTGIGP